MADSLLLRRADEASIEAIEMQARLLRGDGYGMTMQDCRDFLEFDLKERLAYIVAYIWFEERLED